VAVLFHLVFLRNLATHPAARTQISHSRYPHIHAFVPEEIRIQGQRRARSILNPHSVMQWHNQRQSIILMHQSLHLRNISRLPIRLRVNP
jgi:hypothetical protein